MRVFLQKYRLLVWIGAALVLGFVATSVISYWVSSKSIRDSLSKQSLPLTGDTIYSEIQRDMLRPVFISSMMAHDTFVRDWILGSEKDPEQIARYLKEIKSKYGVVTSFLVSENTRKYYHAEGLLKVVNEAESRDAWYFRVRGMSSDYETNVDPDMANRDKMTIFINYRIMDYQGRFIGATGVGMTLDAMVNRIDHYQDRFRRNIYFVDGQGVITLAGKSMVSLRGSIRDLPGLKGVADKILNHSEKQMGLEYPLDGNTMLLNSRYIPELGWYLVVEQNLSKDIRPLQQTFAINLAISASITLFVLVIILLTVRQYQKRLENMAATDTMTGLLNRQAFGFIFNQAILDMNRASGVMSLIVFDIDFFKRVNDEHGHLAGDRVLRDIASLCRQVVRESDIICRWGGEEFLILLKGCSVESARDISEKLRMAVEGNYFALDDGGVRLTISLGVAEYLPGETLNAFFARADESLYQAKNRGRNRTGDSTPQSAG